ncbi:hypothetical protein IFM89_008244 [Coptis chinensis]|uniref:Uncharacterized protein n=1 Tax=Coptis chinensis TaxID=261450 RepID=A0A835IAS4_9MAGN|nr:hypothetical protein IFM89_008244 [Coptis chinensis]
MASSLRSNLALISPSYSSSSSKATTKPKLSYIPIRCGPRDNRGPLQKGRILSTEAMQAIQALKRAKSDPTKLDSLISKTLTRLIKADLISSLNELLRQNHCDLALKVFSTVRTEYWYKTDCSLYADMVLGLSRNGMLEDIDRLVLVLENEGLGESDCKDISRLIRALVAAERKESLVRIYGVLKNGGAGSMYEVDEYVVKVLSRGLKRLGEGKVGEEVVREFGGVAEGKLANSVV